MKLRSLLFASLKCGASLQHVSLGGGVCPFVCAPKVQCQQVFPLSDFVHEISKKTISALKTYFISYFLFQTNAVDARPKLRFLTFVKLL